MDNFAPENPAFSQNGELNIELFVENNKISLSCGDVKFQGPFRNFNNQMPGPTLYVLPGDRLNITLINNLPSNDPDNCPGKHNWPNCFNTVNLHTHGLHVSPGSIYTKLVPGETPGRSTEVTAPHHKPFIASDDVDVLVEPGETQQYCIYIPEFHAPGTHWYHAHKHGATALHLSQGLLGAIVIQDRFDEQIIGDDNPDRVWMIQELTSGSSIYNENEPAERVFLVNGKCLPTLNVQQGRVERWRFINGTASPRGLMKLVLKNSTGLDDEDTETGQAHAMHLFAVDGVPFFGRRTQTVTEQDLAPGGRCDVLVKIDQPGHYKVVKASGGTGHSSSSKQILAYVNVVASGIDDPDPSKFVVSTTRPHYLNPIYDDQLSRHGSGDIRHTFVTFNMEPADEDSDPAGYPGNPVHPTINKQLYDHNRIDHTFQITRSERWQLLSMGGAHPFHIHVNHFQVEGEKIDGSENAPDTPDNWMWRDTVTVPEPTIDGFGKVNIRTRYSTFHGKFVLHCHFLTHEDLGMMQNVEVTGPGVLPCSPIPTPLQPLQVLAAIDPMSLILSYAIYQAINLPTPVPIDQLEREINSKIGHLSAADRARYVKELKSISKISLMLINNVENI